MGNVTKLDYELSGYQSVKMDNDCNRARASFIQRSVDVRQQFSFASPELILQMIQVLCCDGYGSMLWNLQSASAESYFKSWNTCVKLVYKVPRSTYTYLVEGFLAKDQTSLRNQILSRYPGFYTKLLNSPSKEIVKPVEKQRVDFTFARNNKKKNKKKSHTKEIN